MPVHLRELLLEELRDERDLPVGALTERDVFEAGSLLGLGDLIPLASLDLPALRDAPFVPNTPSALRDAARSIFDVIRERDMLVHHPFDSFTATVERFIEAAARDDQVLAIKMTLYRTSGDSPDRGRAHRSGPARQAGGGAGGAEGAVRRGEQHQLGAAARRGGRARGLRRGQRSRRTPRRCSSCGARPTAFAATSTSAAATTTRAPPRIYTDVGLFTCSPHDRRRRDGAVQRAHRILAQTQLSRRCSWRRRRLRDAVHRAAGARGGARAGRPRRRA